MMNSVEIWKDVVGYEDYEGYYQISNFGNFRSKDRYVTNRWKGQTYIEGKTLKPTLAKGYLVVQLNKNSRAKSVKIHRLVCLAFKPNPENKKTVNHIDGVKTNNHIDNLEWSTNRENLIHALDTKLRVNRFGEAHPYAKVSEGTVLLIREMWAYSEEHRIKNNLGKNSTQRCFPITWLDSCFNIYTWPIIKRISWKHI